MLERQEAIQRARQERKTREREEKEDKEERKGVELERLQQQEGEREALQEALPVTEDKVIHRQLHHLTATTRYSTA